jgi:hypothetical protein
MREFSLRNKYIFSTPIIAAFILNLYLSSLSVAEVRADMGWITFIPQQGGFKLRHFIQYTPQIFYLKFFLQYILDLPASKIWKISLVYSMVISSTSELIQVFVPDRFYSIEDIISNLSACLLGYLLYELFKKAFNLFSKQL